MTKSKEDLECYGQWIGKIKAGNVGAVLLDVQGKHIDQKKALECLIAISKVAYNNAMQGEKISASPYELIDLTELFCSFINLKEPTNLLRYTTSLYHIINYLFTKDLFSEITRVFKVLMKIKQSVPDQYCNETRSLHEPYICMVRKCVLKDTDHLNIISLLDIFLQLLIINSELANGALFLKTVLQTCQLVNKTDSKASVRIISSSLCKFYKIEIIKDKDACMPLLLNIYSLLFTYQLTYGEPRIALTTLESHFNEAKWRFSTDVYYGECFLLLLNVVKLFKWDCSVSVFLKKIEECNKKLDFIKQVPNKTSIEATCSHVLILLANSYKTVKCDQVIPRSCLRPFLEMMVNMYTVLKDKDNENAIQCLFQALLHVTNENTMDIMKECGQRLIEIVTQMLDILHMLRRTSEAKRLTHIALVRCSNLLRSYKLATLPNEALQISKLICKFICHLSYEEFEDIYIQQSTEMCFRVHNWALGCSQLDKCLESIMAWLIKCPQDVKKGFKLWGDMKHNALCEGHLEHLDITVWTLLTERKATLEREWTSCRVNKDVIATFLVYELATYFVNKALTGRPVVIAAVSSLLALDVDCFTKVQGIVIAMNIASTSEQFAGQCREYYNQSKHFITKLRKEKKNIDPVDYNSYMGNLLYAQLRCELRFLREDCESEVLNNTIAPAEPLVKELPENVPDPNDTCNVTTRYHNICLAKQRKLMEYIDSALRSWSFAYDMLKVKDVGEYDLTVTLGLMQEAGYLLRLYSEDVKEAKLWQLLYNFAVLIEDFDMTICAAGEAVHTKSDTSTDVLENIRIKLDNKEVSDNTKLNFLLNTATYYLHNDKIMEGLEVTDNIDKTTKKIAIHNIQSLIMVGQFQALCDWSTYNHTFASTCSFHLSFHKALSYLRFLSEENKWRTFAEVCQIHHQLLQVAQILGKANWALEQPRHARCYLKSLLGLAQKLALPLRAVELLLALAWVDLCTGLVNGCAAKLSGVEDLLELCGTPLLYNELASQPLNRNMLSSPEYLNHTSPCCCLHCTSLQYQRLVLETFTLRATFLSIYGEKNDASQCFEVAVCVEENLRKAENPQTYHACALLWLYYAGFMASRENYQEACAANTKAIHLLTLLKNPILLQHAIELKATLQYQQLQLLQLIPVGPQITTTHAKKLALDTGTPCGLKTPKNNVSPRKIPLGVRSNNIDNISPITPPIIPIVRPFKLPLSEDENTPILISKNKKQTNTARKVMLKTPTTTSHQSKTTKTPFVIYDDDKSNKTPSPRISRFTRNRLMKENVETSKKNLFLSSHTKSKETSDSIVRKTSRSNSVKTYSRRQVSDHKISKLGAAQAGNKNTSENKSCENSAFTFSEMINSIDSLSSTTKEIAENEMPNEKYACKSIIKQTIKRNARSDLPKEVEYLNDSECDFVEGTPPESPKEIKVRSKRVTRSKN